MVLKLDILQFEEDKQKSVSKLMRLPHSFVNKFQNIKKTKSASHLVKYFDQDEQISVKFYNFIT